MVRPTGVTIIAIVAAINGVFDVLAGAGHIINVKFPYIAEVTNQSGAWALLIVGLVWLLLGWAFWSGQNWARLLGLIWSGVSIAAAALVLVTHLDVLTTILVPVVVSIIVPIIVFWYLREERVKAFFTGA